MEQREIIDRVAAILKEYVSSQKENGFLHFKEPRELGEILRLDDHRDGAN